MSLLYVFIVKFRLDLGHLDSMMTFHKSTQCLAQVPMSTITTAFRVAQVELQGSFKFKLLKTKDLSRLVVQ